MAGKKKQAETKTHKSTGPLTTDDLPEPTPVDTTGPASGSATGPAANAARDAADAETDVALAERKAEKEAAGVTPPEPVSDLPSIERDWTISNSPSPEEQRAADKRAEAARELEANPTKATQND